jgi:hypothetical protein
MGIVNRRNAVLGWTAWNIAKRVLKKKAKQVVPGTVEGTSKPNRSAIAAAVAAAVGAVWFWRRKSDDAGPAGE